MPAAGKDASVVGRRPVLMPVGPGAKPRDDSGVYGRCDPARGLPLRLAQQRRVQGVPALAVGGHEQAGLAPAGGLVGCAVEARSEEHTSELPSLMRSSYAVFCLKKKKK